MTAQSLKTKRVKPILLTPVEAQRKLKHQLVIDVQTSKFTAHTIPNAKRLNLDISVKDISKNQPVLITCLNGQRSLMAAQQLIKRGYRKVYVLKGGIEAWQRAGYTLWRTKAPA